MTTLDFNSPPAGHSYSITVEPTEIESDRKVRHFKEIALFAVALTLVVIVAGLCIAGLTSATASADDRKWCQSLLSATLGGLLGYLVRK